MLAFSRCRTRVETHRAHAAGQGHVGRDGVLKNRSRPYVLIGSIYNGVYTQDMSPIQGWKHQKGFLYPEFGNDNLDVDCGSFV